MDELIDKVRTALRITTNDYDTEISDLVNACLLDLNIAGVNQDDTANALIVRAVITYCRANFGDSMGDYEKLKASYDEQKAQMSMLTGYTDWLNS